MSCHNFRITCALMLLVVLENILPLATGDAVHNCRRSKCTVKRPDAPPHARAWGDPHYTTFDNAHHDYQGTCRLLQTESNVTGDGFETFKIFTKSEQRPGFGREFYARRVSFVKYIELHVYNHTFRLKRAQLEVDGVVTRIPYFYPPSEDCDASCLLHVERAGTAGVELYTSFGLAISYDGIWTSHISIPNDKRLRGQLRGLSGNWDGNAKNDFMMPNGKITNDMNYFGDSWIVPDPEDLNCHTSPEPDLCTEAAHNVAEQKCSHLKNHRGIFAKCLLSQRGSDTADRALHGCVYDVCAASGADTVACRALETFAHFCKTTLGVHDLNWRSKKLCPIKCNAGMIYANATDLIEPTCDNPTPSIKRDDGRRREGCICEKGLVYNTVTSSCVKLEECGCKDERGIMRKIGTSWISPNCTQMLTCYANQTISSKPYDCPDHKVCGTQKGLFTCVCGKGKEERNGKCVDLDECGRNPTICGKTGKCKNGPHGYECICNPGYEKNGHLCFPHNVTVEKVEKKREINVKYTAKDFPIDHSACRLKRCQRKRADSRPFCYAGGDPHYWSMDERRNDYQGTCKLVAMQNQNHSSAITPPFAVYSKSEHRTGFHGEFGGRQVSFLKYVEVEVYGHHFRLSKNGALKVDGVRVAAPYFYPPSEDCSNDTPCMVFVDRFGANGLELSTDFGLAVSYDGNHQMHISPPNTENLKRHLGGICGYWDGDPKNDWMLPNGQLTTNMNDFGDSWTVPDIEDMACTKKHVIGGLHLSEVSKKRAAELCDPLKDPDGPFEKCLSDCATMKLAKSHYHSCMFDVGAASGNDEVACTAMTAFAKTCAAMLMLGKFDWRNDSSLCQPHCKAGMHYSYNASLLFATCDNPFPDLSRDDGRRTESCVCDEELVYDVITKSCMKLEECGCRDCHGFFHKSGEEWLSPNCTVHNRCNHDHTVTTTPHVCAPHLVCRTHKEKLACACPKGKELRNEKCVDVDECSQHALVCGTNAVCKNAPHGYLCECKPGFVKNGAQCIMPHPHTNDSSPVKGVVRYWEFHHSSHVSSANHSEVHTLISFAHG